nr:unnamed protein product [Callosobruchus chinensis]
MNAKKKLHYFFDLLSGKRDTVHIVKGQSYDLRHLPISLQNMMCVWLFLPLVLQSVGATHYKHHFDNEQEFETKWSWSYVNYTWPSAESYSSAVRSRRYLPQNIMVAGPRIYKDKVYITMPKFRPGVPVTLGSFQFASPERINIPIKPYPSWEMNTLDNCRSLQSVLGTEGSSDGMFMDNRGDLYYGILSMYGVGRWSMFEPFETSEVIYENRETLIWPDGFTMDTKGNLYLVSNQAFRFFVSNETLLFTPEVIKFRINVLYTGAKNYMYSLNKTSLSVQLTVIFAAHNVSHHNVFETVWSWSYVNYTWPSTEAYLTALATLRKRPRTLFYTPLTGHGLFAISTTILKNENSLKDQKWRGLVQLVGQKLCSTDGMVMDSKGNLYYGLLCLSGVGKWNMFEPFESSECLFVYVGFSILSIVVEGYVGDYNDGDQFGFVWSWSYVNYTWPSHTSYYRAVVENRYLPQNVMPGGPKIYKDKVFVTMPKFRAGVPATLGYFPMMSKKKTNILISPFPSWKMNYQGKCWNLQSVLGTEIDRKGVMWVLDGHRSSNAINGIGCPPKLVLLDLKLDGAVIHMFTFPNDVCLTDGGFLNDVVIDDTNGTYAYITDNSVLDPGLIVYSYRDNMAWKLRDGSMFPQVSAAGYVVDGFQMNYLGTIDGIALSPLTTEHPRTLFYSALTGFSIYSITTDILQNRSLIMEDSWRGNVKFVGDKVGTSDGMIMDNTGTLYYTIESISGIGKWNMFEPFEKSEVIYVNPKTMVWPDGFTMDLHGNLYLINTYAFRFFASNETLQFTPDFVKFRIHVMHTGTKNYLYQYDHNNHQS